MELQVLCEKRLGKQLSSLAEVCTHFSAFLYDVYGNPTMNTITVRALRRAKMRPRIMLPAMYKPYMPEPGKYRAPLMKEVPSLMTLWRLSGRPIAVAFERLRELRGAGTILRSAMTLLANTLEQVPFLSRCRSRISVTTSF